MPIVTISLNDIDMEDHIANMVEKNGGDMSPYRKNVYAAVSFSLDQDRLDSCMNGLKGNGVPPISVARLLGGRYEVMNGRHRIAAAILLGRTTIEAKY